MATCSKDRTATGSVKHVDITGSERCGGVAVGQGKRTEGSVAHEHVENVVGGVGNKVENAVLCRKFIGINGDGVVVGVKDQQTVVHGKVEQAAVAINGCRPDVKFNRHQRYEGVCRCQDLNDHLRDFCIRRKVPSCIGIAVWVQATAVRGSRCESVLLAEDTQTAPVEQRCSHAVHREVWVFDG